MNFDDLDMPDNAARLPLRKMSLDPFLTLNLEHLDLISTITERSSDQNKICEDSHWAPGGFVKDSYRIARGCPEDS